MKGGTFMEHSVLSFLLDYLSDLQVQYILTERNDFSISFLDLGLRDNILKISDATPLSLMKELEDNTLYHITDCYNCNYSFFQFSGEQKYLFIGPYLLEEVTEPDIYRLMETLEIPLELFSQLQEYYHALPHVAEKHIFHTLLLRLYGTVCEIKEPRAIHIDLNDLEAEKNCMHQHRYQIANDPILNMQLLEKRYSIEDTLLDAVSHGNISKALSALDSISSLHIAPRSADPLRNTKNLMITFNTLLRRTAYASGVHPFYIDSISSNYARLIEQSHNMDELTAISPFMARSYCDLVEKRSMNSYSEPIRHILVTVDASLTTDLSLRRFANELFLNTSYLSALFKKEMGITLTDYVNKNRIAHAKKLLRSTTLSIQAIAAQSGISDIHYFTRLFRRETDMSPREWRNQ